MKMPSIESLGGPLVFKVASPSGLVASGEGDQTSLRLRLRALQGMQKEALVHDGPSGATWRMVSDEGPYLQGTDLAPFPLAFYTSGIVFSYMEEVLRHAAALGAGVDSLRVVSDHGYTMEGSALRGDMIGGAKPVEVTVELGTDADEEVVARIAEMAKASSPAEAYMRDSLQNTFSLTANGRRLEVADLAQSPNAAENPEGDFDSVETAGEEELLGDIITKLAAAEVVHGVEGGAGSSLKAEQKRMLHVRGEGRLVSGTLKEVKVHLFKPIGSTFRFLSDEGEDAKAPPGLAYLAAGVGFCYMTQIGRYAHITKRALKSYSVVQDNVFHRSEAGESAAEPVDTHVFLTLDDGDEVARKIVIMSERTCFLHAAMRGAHPTQLRVLQEETS